MGQVEGHILLEGGASPEGVVVAFTGTGFQATFRADGSFTFTGVPTGTYSLTATKDGYADGQQVEVKANETASVSLTLARLRGTVSGAVLLLEGSASLEGVAVTLTDTDFQATTGADGRFTFTGVPTGTYGLTAMKGGYAEGLQQVEVRANESASASLILESLPPPTLVSPPALAVQGGILTLRGSGFGA